MQGDLSTKMSEFDGMDLRDTTQADGPQILLESWIAALESVRCADVLQFVRSLEEIQPLAAYQC